MVAPAAATGAADEAPAAIVTTWQEHKLSLDYFGITSTYSCSAIEGKLRQVLLQLGARKDLSANAAACDLRGMPFSRGLTVMLHFFTLAPADPAAPAASQVAAHWVPALLQARQPSLLGAVTAS